MFFFRVTQNPFSHALDVLTIIRHTAMKCHASIAFMKSAIVLPTMETMMMRRRGSVSRRARTCIYRRASKRMSTLAAVTAACRKLIMPFSSVT